MFELVGDQSLESVVSVPGVRTRSLQRLGPQGPQLSCQGERERCVVIARRVGGQYVAVFVQSPTHLSHNNTFVTLSNKVWEVYFSKELCPFVVIELTMFLHVYEYVTQPLCYVYFQKNNQGQCYFSTRMFCL